MRFLIPLFQRNYQWGNDEIIRFWEDIEAESLRLLERKSKYFHYMGAIIFAEVPSMGEFGVTQKIDIIDGQQRCTTF